MLHFHISSVLPHEIYSTSAIRPYPAALGPAAIASRTAHEWLPSIMHPGQASSGPALHPGLQPEEVARLANRLAGALAQGMEAPAWINKGLLRIAKMLLQGKAVAITSAGRSITVRAEAPSSWIGIRQGTALQGAESAQPGSVTIRRRDADSASWIGIDHETRVRGGQPGMIVQRTAGSPSSWTGIRRAYPSRVYGQRWRGIR